MQIKMIVDCKTVLGEGPLWDVEQQKLYWLDVYDPRIFRADENGNGVETWDMPEKVGSIALRKDDSAILALASGFYFFDFKTGRIALMERLNHKLDTVRLNDGKVDHRGRFLSGGIEIVEKQAASCSTASAPTTR